MRKLLPLPLKSPLFRSSTLACLLGLPFLWWACAFSLDLADEAYSVIPGWKLLPQGEKLFAFEMYNAPRHHDLLNYFLIQPWVPYSLLAIRRIGVLLYALQIALLCGVCFRARFTWIAALTGLACLVLGGVGLPFSYNVWARGMLVLHAAALSCAFSSEKARPQWALGAGVALGIATVAYIPLGAVFTATSVAVALIWWLSPSQRVRCGQNYWPYAGGFAIPLALLALTIGVTGQGPALLGDLQALSALGDYQNATPLRHLWHYLRWLTNTPEFLWGLLFFALLQWGQKWERLRLFFFAAFTVHLAWRWGLLADGHETLRAWNGLTLAACLVLGAAYPPWASAPFFLALVAGVSALCTIVHFSASGLDSCLWALPALFVPVVAQATQSLENKVGRLLVVALLVILIQGGVRSTLTFRTDVPLAQMTATLKTPPLTGIRTSPRRAELVEKIAEHTHGKQFILAYPFVAGAYYFGMSRPAVKTLASQPVQRAEVRNETLRWTREQQRYPELLIRLKVNSWQWGLAAGPSALLPADDPYSLFAACAQSRVVLSVPELEILELDAQRTRECLQR